MLNLEMYKEQKVAILIDVQNMYYSGKNLYNSKLNYEEVIKAAVGGRKLIRAVGYTIKADVKDEKIFHTALENLGIEVKTKDLLVFHGGHKKGDWDVGLAVDAIRMADKVDSIIVISGDGDFLDMYEYVKHKGCRIEVVAFGKTASSSIKDYVDRFVDLDRDQKRFLAPLKPNAKNKKEDEIGVNKAVDEIKFIAETNAEEQKQKNNKPINKKPQSNIKRNNFNNRNDRNIKRNNFNNRSDRNDRNNKRNNFNNRSDRNDRNVRRSYDRYGNEPDFNNKKKQSFTDNADDNVEMPTYANLDDSINDLDFDGNSQPDGKDTNNSNKEKVENKSTKKVSKTTKKTSKDSDKKAKSEKSENSDTNQAKQKKSTKKVTKATKKTSKDSDKKAKSEKATKKASKDNDKKDDKKDSNKPKKGLLGKLMGK